MSGRIFRTLFLFLLICLSFTFFTCGDNDDDDNDSYQPDDDDTSDDDTSDDDTSDDDTEDDDAADDDNYDIEDLIENSGFETGEIDPWFGEYTGDILCNSTTCEPFEGDYAAWLGNCANCTETLKQNILLLEGYGGIQINYFYKLSKQENAQGQMVVDLYDENGEIQITKLHRKEIDQFPENGQWNSFVWDFDSDDFEQYWGQTIQMRFQLEISGGETATASVQLDEVHFIWIGC